MTRQKRGPQSYIYESQAALMVTHKAITIDTPVTICNPGNPITIGNMGTQCWLAADKK